MEPGDGFLHQHMLAVRCEDKAAFFCQLVSVVRLEAKALGKLAGGEGFGLLGNTDSASWRTRKRMRLSRWSCAPDSLAMRSMLMRGW